MATKKRPKLRRFTSKQQNRFMWSQHPKIARRWANRMKRSGHTKHPVKPLPKYSKSKSAQSARRRKGRK